MRYLKEREEFIKNNKFSNLSPVNEASDSGPLANDIPWGDSLVGRLINSIIRKVRIGADLVRIDAVINKLKETFDSIISDAKITGSSLGKETLIKLDMIKISTLLGELKSEVEKGSDKEVVIKLTKSTIQSIADLSVQPESEKVKKEAIDKLNEFLKSIESKEEVKVKSDDTVYPKMLENFTSVYNILCQYDKMKKKVASEVPKKAEDTQKAEVEVPKEKEVEKVPVKSEVKPPISKFESMINESIDASLLKSIKPLYDYSKQFFEFPEDENRKKDEFFNLVGNQQNKAPLMKIYSYIKRKSVNENLVNLLTKPENMGAKILALYQVTKSKESGDFIGIDENMKREIAKFNSTMKSILTPQEVKTETPKSENSLFRYSQFKLIKEADVESPKVEPTEGEDKSTEPTKEVKKESDIKLHWVRIFNPEFMKKWIVTEEEARRVNAEVEKLTKDSTKIVINGIDPIVEIVQIFNRAYKLHTVENIPSGRTGERVSSMTKRDYIYMGEGTTPTGADAGGKGPWRVKSIWNKWEEAVLNIIKDSKYQVLFNEDTIVKVGKADPRINVVKKDGQKKQGGGKTLLTLINSMLDGSKLYKSGAQSKFIEEYFNVEVPSERLGLTKGDIEKNNKNSEKVDPSKESKKKYSFKEIKEINSNFDRTFYAIKTLDKKYYLSILDSDEEFIYVKYSDTFFTFNKCASGLAKIDKGSMESINMRERKDTDQNLYPVHYGRIAKGKFPIKDGVEIELKSIDLLKYNEDTKNTNPEIVKITRIEKIYGLVDDENKLFKLPGDKSSSSGSKADGKNYNDYKTVLKK
jgi:hypothetical protein